MLRPKLLRRDLRVFNSSLIEISKNIISLCVTVVNHILIMETPGKNIGQWTFSLTHTCGVTVLPSWLPWPSVQCCALPRQPDIVALGCAKGLLHDWTWADNGPKECGGTLWRNTPILFSPWLTIKRVEEAGGLLRYRCWKHCSGLWDGMRQQQVVDLAPRWLCRALASVNVKLRSK